MSQSRLDAIADRSIRWVGSTSSLVLHTILFVGVFAAGILGASWNEILLVLTTAVSLEAIYLAIFIQITVNRHSSSLQEVTQDIDEIQEDVEEIQEDVDEIQEDIDEIQEDVGEIQEDEKDDEAKMKDQVISLENIKAELSKIIATIDQVNKHIELKNNS